MNKILLKFAIILENEGLSKHYGPLFHRWLPNGIKDAINLNTGDNNSSLKVWFERRGFVHGGFIVFNYKEHDVDEKIIPSQGVLEGGPLFGLLEFRGLSDKELEAIQEDKKDDHYLTFGKKIINKIIYPCVSRFLNILRISYGQSWIKGLEKWDSRKESLGSYCSLIELWWSLDDGKNWHKFRPPNKPHAMVKVTMPSREELKQFITNDDWKKIKVLTQSDYEQTLAIECLIRSRDLLIEGNIRNSLIEGVTALEIAIEEFIQNQVKSASYPNDFFDINILRDLRTKLRNIAVIRGNISIENIEKALIVIERRHKVVHEGWNPAEEDFPLIKSELAGLYYIVISLIKCPVLKFPSPNTGNAIGPPEYWDK